MKKTKLSLRDDIRIRLLQKGYHSYQQWAISHGYRRITVTQVIRRHVIGGRPATGDVTKRILLDLSSTTGIKLTG